MYLKTGIIMLLGIILLASCGHKKPRYEKVSPEKEDQLEVSMKRYEQDLFTIPPGKLEEQLPELQNHYSYFLGDEAISEQQFKRLYDYVTDPLIIELYEKTKEVYPDNEWLYQELTSLFSYFRHYFPEKAIPQVYTYVSGIAYETPVEYADNVLIIALDMYLGSDFKPYQEAGIPAYQRKRMEKPYLAVDISKALAEHYLPSQTSRGKLIDQIIHHGKKHYFADALLPQTHDSLKIKYSPEQLAWCKKSEKQLWAFIIENELLFSGRHSKYQKLLSEGPFTSEFGKESPPRIGHWIGWQIIREFMENNPDVSLKEMMAINDAQMILEKSGYKP
ncbi:MAG: hypothetical protein ACQESX_00165 [Bacteroidota bacterium]